MKGQDQNKQLRENRKYTERRKLQKQSIISPERSMKNKKTSCHETRTEYNQKGTFGEQ